MHDSFLVHVLESTRNLTYVFYYSLLLETYILFHALLDYKFQVSFLCPLDGNKEFVEFVINEPIEILDDVWVI